MTAELRSQEELWFAWYLDELGDAGYIDSYAYEVESFLLSPKQEYIETKQLKTKEKQVERLLLHPHRYTPDFVIEWDNKAQDIFTNIEGLKPNPFYVNYNDTSIIETKGSFDNNNMTRLFSINQKWMYDKLEIYVQLIKPLKLFEETFTPKRFFLTDKSMKKRKLNYEPRTLEEYLNGNK